MSTTLFDRAGLSVASVARPGGPRLSIVTSPGAVVLGFNELRDLIDALATFWRTGGSDSLPIVFESDEEAKVWASFAGSAIIDTEAEPSDATAVADAMLIAYRARQVKP